MEKTKGIWPLWNLPSLQSAETRAVPASLGRFACTLCRADAPVQVRFGACAQTGAASRLEYRLKWQKCGWEPLCERGALIAFGASPDAKIPDDDGLDRHFARAIRRRERARIALFVLAALSMILGYAMEGFTVVRLAAVPLAGALALSLSISRLQKAAAQMENR